jgi:hypothetical protein
VETYVDRLGPADSWQLWQSLLEDGLERRRPADDPTYAEARLRYRLAIGASMIIAAAGAALVVLGLSRSVRRRPASTSLSGSRSVTRGI